jgi:beta-glucosidase
LSYSTYQYEAPKLSKKQIKSDESTSISVKLTNTGKYGGAEIVQLYIRDDFSQITRPVKELKGFKRIYLESGESATIEFLVEPDMLAYYNRDMEWTVERGSYTLMIGSSSRQSDLKSAKLIVN